MKKIAFFIVMSMFISSFVFADGGLDPAHGVIKNYDFIDPSLWVKKEYNGVEIFEARYKNTEKPDSYLYYYDTIICFKSEGTEARSIRVLSDDNGYNYGIENKRDDYQNYVITRGEVLMLYILPQASYEITWHFATNFEKILAKEDRYRDISNKLYTNYYDNFFEKVEIFPYQNILLGKGDLDILALKTIQNLHKGETICVDTFDFIVRYETNEDYYFQINSKWAPFGDWYPFKLNGFLVDLYTTTNSIVHIKKNDLISFFSGSEGFSEEEISKALTEEQSVFKYFLLEDSVKIEKLFGKFENFSSPSWGNRKYKVIKDIEINKGYGIASLWLEEIPTQYSTDPELQFRYLSSSIDSLSFDVFIGYGEKYNYLFLTSSSYILQDEEGFWIDKLKTNSLYQINKTDKITLVEIAKQTFIKCSKNELLTKE